jgi:hypothetical protein
LNYAAQKSASWILLLASGGEGGGWGWRLAHPLLPSHNIGSPPPPPPHQLGFQE